MTDEVIVSDPTTGARKGRKLARFDLMPGDALHAVAEHFGRGAEKYAERNWEGGYAWSLSFGAMQRHLWAWWQGEDVDPETGSSHMVAAAWHALALTAYELRGAGTDDRPVSHRPRRKRRKDAGVPRSIRSAEEAANAARVVVAAAWGAAGQEAFDRVMASDMYQRSPHAPFAKARKEAHAAGVEPLTAEQAAAAVAVECGYPDCHCDRPETGCEGRL